MKLTNSLTIPASTRTPAITVVPINIGDLFINSVFKELIKYRFVLNPRIPRLVASSEFREWSKRLGMTNKFVFWLRFIIQTQTFTATHTRVLCMGKTVLPLRHRTNDSKNDELKTGWNALFVARTMMGLADRAKMGRRRGTTRRADR